MQVNTSSRRQAWLAMHAALWGQHDWDDGSLVAICRARQGGFGLVDVVDVEDAERAWRLIANADAQADTTSTYIGMGTLNAKPAKGRGGADDVQQIGWLWADVDTADGEHKPAKDGLPHPTREQAMDVLLAAPWGPPTLTIDSGGGFHAYYVLLEPLDGHEERTEELLARFDQWLAQAFNSRGLTVDRGLSADLARILRPAGTANRKHAVHRPVRIADVDPARRFDVDELMSWLPEVQAHEAASGRPARSEHAPTATGKGDRPGDRLNATPGALGALLESEGLRPADRDRTRWVYPRPDGTYSREDTHAVVLTGAPEGIERLYVHGERMARDWGVATGDAWSAFEVLALRKCGGDFSLAARVVAAHEAEARSAATPTTPSFSDDEEIF